MFLFFSFDRLGRMPEWKGIRGALKGVMGVEIVALAAAYGIFHGYARPSYVCSNLFGIFIAHQRSFYVMLVQQHIR